MMLLHRALFNIKNVRAACLDDPATETSEAKAAEAHSATTSPKLSGTNET